MLLVALLFSLALSRGSPGQLGHPGPRGSESLGPWGSMSRADVDSGNGLFIVEASHLLTERRGQEYVSKYSSKTVNVRLKLFHTVDRNLDPEAPRGPGMMVELAWLNGSVPNSRNRWRWYARRV
jgi:hypothetical protein